MKENSINPQDSIETVYTKNGITYLPHYSEVGVFVCPGYGLTHWMEYSETELIRGGAQKGERFLWRRPSGPASIAARKK